MIRVEPALFSNVITTVQRTGSLTGGAVRGLPGGVVIDGLQGIHSFGANIADAQKEYNLGRVRTALERVRQLEMQFNGIAGRWNSTVGSVISSARQGHQKLSLQKLNEVKNAQGKMQQLTGPASKAFRDLVSALEHAVTMEGRSHEEQPGGEATQAEAGETLDSEVRQPPETPESSSNDSTPDAQRLGSFAENYRFGAKLGLQKGDDGKTRLIPKLETDRFYWLAGSDPPCVVRVREIRRQSVLVLDTHQSREVLIDGPKLRALIRLGIWELVARESMD